MPASKKAFKIYDTKDTNYYARIDMKTDYLIYKNFFIYNSLPTP